MMMCQARRPFNLTTCYTCTRLYWRPSAASLGVVGQRTTALAVSICLAWCRRACENGHAIREGTRTRLQAIGPLDHQVWITEQPMIVEHVSNHSDAILL